MRDGSWRGEISPDEKTGPRTCSSIFDVFEKTKFGFVVGFFTGGVLGIPDGYRMQPSKNPFLKEIKTVSGRQAINSKMLASLKVGGRSAAALSGFYSLYFATKSTIEWKRNTIDLVNAGIATPLAAIPVLAFFPVFRRQLLYGVGLVVMDVLAENKIL